MWSAGPRLFFLCLLPGILIYILTQMTIRSIYTHTSYHRVYRFERAASGLFSFLLSSKTIEQNRTGEREISFLCLCLCLCLSVSLPLPPPPSLSSQLEALQLILAEHRRERFTYQGGKNSPPITTTNNGQRAALLARLRPRARPVVRWDDPHPQLRLRGVCQLLSRRAVSGAQRGDSTNDRPYRPSLEHVTLDELGPFPLGTSRRARVLEDGLVEEALAEPGDDHPDQGEVGRVAFPVLRERKRQQPKQKTERRGRDVGCLILAVLSRV